MNEFEKGLYFPDPKEQRIEELESRIAKLEAKTKELFVVFEKTNGNDEWSLYPSAKYRYRNTLLDPWVYINYQPANQQYGYWDKRPEGCENQQLSLERNATSLEYMSDKIKQLEVEKAELLEALDKIACIFERARENDEWDYNNGHTMRDIAREAIAKSERKQ